MKGQMAKIGEGHMEVNYPGAVRQFHSEDADKQLLMSSEHWGH